MSTELSPERGVGLGIRGYERPGLYSYLGWHFSLDILFSHFKASAANIGIIAILVHFEKISNSSPLTINFIHNLDHPVID